jgi:hypothetical protein
MFGSPDEHFQLRVIRDLAIIKEQGARLMDIIEELKAAVAKETGLEESVIVLLHDLSEKLQGAISTGNMADLQQILNQVNANADRLAQAVTDNTQGSTS